MSSRKGAQVFSSLMKDAVLWWPGLETTEFPIIPSGVTVTPNGTFYKDDLGNNKSVVKFDGSTNYISLSDNATWDFGSGDFTICFWFRASTTSNMLFLGQSDNNGTNARCPWLASQTDIMAEDWVIVDA